MKQKQNPHDQFFKETLAQPGAASDFLRYYLPESFVRLIKPESARRVEDSFVDQELREHLSDVLLRVELKTKGEAFIYVLLEHKSSPDRWVALQLLRYLVRIWEKARLEGSKRLPLIFPVVFYHGRVKWRVSKRFSALLDLVGETEELRENLPEFRYHLCDLAELDDEDMKGDAHLQGAMRLLKYIFRSEIGERMEGAFRVVMEGMEEGGLDEQAIAFIHYLLKTGKATEREIGRVVRRINEAKGGKMMETAYDRILNKGVRQGMQQGVQQGMQQGSRETALSLTLRLLRRRLGRISHQAEKRIRGLSTTKLEELSEALLDFDKAKDLSRWLDENAAK
jgi:predicted transposase/invertase (TIGR01784 family)